MTSTPPAAPAVAPPPGFVLAEPALKSPADTYLDGLDSDGSRKTMRDCLTRIARQMITEEPPPPLNRYAWWLLRFEHTQAIRAALRSSTTQSGQAWSPAYVNKHLVALRQVLRACRRLTLMNADEYETAADIDKVSGRREPVGRSVADDEISKVLAVCLADGTATGVRDAAMIALMHATGCRRAEVAGARRASYDPASRALQIIGKGDKQRTVFLHTRAGAWMNAWLALVPAGAGPLFRPIHWSGNIQDRHIQPPSVEYILTRRCRQAHVATFAPHDLRRTFISNFLRAGGDLPLAQRQAGHESVSTTARYDRRDDSHLQEAVEHLWLPLPGDLESARLAAYPPMGEGDLSQVTEPGKALP